MQSPIKHLAVVAGWPIVCDQPRIRNRSASDLRRLADEKGDFMKLTFSNLLAVASILVWASAWVATEAKATSKMTTAPASNADVISVSSGLLQASR